MTHDKRWTTEIAPSGGHAVFFAPSLAGHTTPTYLTMAFPGPSLASMREALAEATRIGARISVYCDTAEQADARALHIGKALPKHRRVPYEMAAADVWETRPA